VTLAGATSATATFATSIATSYGFEVVATDGYDNYSWALGSVTVQANWAPSSAAAGASSTSVFQGTSVGLTAAATDADGETLTYSWAVTSGPLGSNAALSEAGVATPTFVATRLGTYTMTVTVSDPKGTSTTAAVNVEVKAQTNALPIAGSVPDRWGWIRRDGVAPCERYGHKVAYDKARGRTVLFGGLNAAGTQRYDDTWEWDGAQWQQRMPSTHPSVRASHAMAYDETRRCVVLFGGFDGSPLGDTWEWNGTDWNHRSSSTSPAPQYGHGMAFDGQRGRVVLLGGTASLAGELWDWDGSNWTLRLTGTAPSPRYYHSLAADLGRRRLVVFGGRSGAADLSDTWEFDGTAWSLKTPATHPPTSRSHGMYYDQDRGRTVLFGGYTEGSDVQDTWEWDGVNWTRKSTASFPSLRGLHSIAWDAARSKALLFGGYQRVNGALFADTWEYDGTNWAQKGPVTGGPPARWVHGIAYDDTHRKTVLFGGTSDDGTTKLNDTWEFDGVVWQERTPSTGPSPRYCPQLASGRSGVVLFGGHDTGPVVDTWDWNGATWSRLTPASSPGSRWYTALAQSLTPGRILLFGGFDPAKLDDTWELDSTTWTLKSPASKPGARCMHAMATDTARNRVIAYGGLRDTVLADIWEWDGASWSDRTPATSLRGRRGASLDFDSRRSQSILFGGLDADYKALADTWAWNGVSWRALALSQSPPARWGAGGAYDEARKCSLVFGGNPGGGVWTNYSDTWELPSNQPPIVTATLTPTAPRVGETVTLAATFADPDGDTPTFRWLQTFGPRVTLNGASSATATFATSVATSYGFEIVADDGRQGYAYALGAVAVAPNRPPVSAAITTSTTRTLPAAGVGLWGHASDPDGDALSYAWTVAAQPAGGNGSIDPTPSPTTAFSATRAGTYTVRLTVSDGRGGSTSATTNLVVNTPPTVTAGGGRTVLVNTPVTLTATASDADGDPLSYRWTQTAGAGLSLANPNTAASPSRRRRPTPTPSASPRPILRATARPPPWLSPPRCRRYPTCARSRSRPPARAWNWTSRWASPAR
jgi:hypothetical protein